MLVPPYKRETGRKEGTDLTRDGRTFTSSAHELTIYASMFYTDPFSVDSYGWKSMGGSHR